MPRYRYVATTLDGASMQGEAIARDKNELVNLLVQHKQFLVSCEEIGQSQPKPQAPIPVDKAVERSAETEVNMIGAILWTQHALRQEVLAKLPAKKSDQPDSNGNLSLTGLRVWAAKNSRLLSAVVGSIVLLYALNSMHGVRGPATPAKPHKSMVLMPVKQPEMSAKELNGRVRWRKVFAFKHAHASDVKSALDQVMRQTSLSSELTPSLDNSFAVMVTPGELQMITFMLKDIDIDYRQEDEDQIILSIIDTLAAAKQTWLNTPASQRAPAAKRR